jgi:hypothetical protein
MSVSRRAVILSALAAVAAGQDCSEAAGDATPVLLPWRRHAVPMDQAWGIDLVLDAHAELLADTCGWSAWDFRTANTTG